MPTPSSLRQPEHIPRVSGHFSDFKSTLVWFLLSWVSFACSRISYNGNLVCVFSCVHGFWQLSRDFLSSSALLPVPCSDWVVIRCLHLLQLACVCPSAGRLGCFQLVLLWTKQLGIFYVNMCFHYFFLFLVLLFPQCWRVNQGLHTTSPVLFIWARILLRAQDVLKLGDPLASDS